jgi:hypothetical protein
MTRRAFDTRRPCVGAAARAGAAARGYGYSYVLRHPIPMSWWSTPFATPTTYLRDSWPVGRREAQLLAVGPLDGASRRPTASSWT